MMNSGSTERIASSDIERRRKALKARIYDYKKKGYNVSRFADLIDGDIAVAEEAFIDFLNDVHILEELEDRFYRLDTKGFEREAEEIEAMLRDPDRIRELESALVSLEEKIHRKKNEMKNRIDTPTSEEDLRAELERIREEELRRIREEEANRLREQERRRILNEELERIRKEEEEKLRKKELERIRNEERERLVWEERVMRQLRQIKEKPKEKKKIKKLKCPACGADIVVTSSKRPLKIRCPECGKNYTLRAKEDLREERKKDEPRIKKYKKCPKCGAPIPIMSDRRPLKIICQNCGSEYILKGKKEEVSNNGVKKSVRKTATSTSIPVESLVNPPLPLKQKTAPSLEVKSYGEQPDIDASKTIVCPTCGNEIPADAKVCGYCGSPIEEEDRRAALEGGGQKGDTITCPSCGNEIPADAKVCGYCGTPVQPAQPTAPSPDDFELPPVPTRKENETLEDKTKFTPLNEYDLQSEQSEPDLPPVEPIRRRNEPAPLPSSTAEDKSSDMIVCPKCGNLVPRGSKFCGSCGNPM